jgi:hypothetical protein
MKHARRRLFQKLKRWSGLALPASGLSSRAMLKADAIAAVLRLF